MSPQVKYRKSYTEKTDVWSVGAIFYCLLNGETPYEAKTMEDFDKKHKESVYKMKEEFMIANMTLEGIILMISCL